MTKRRPKPAGRVPCSTCDTSVAVDARALELAQKYGHVCRWCRARAREAGQGDPAQAELPINDSKDPHKEIDAT